MAELTDEEWLPKQVSRYRRLRPRYVRFADALREILQDEVRRSAPTAIVQARAKSIASFAEKALRKRDKYPDPANDFRDLCGARVIVRTPGELTSLERFIQTAFEIEWETSEDVSRRLQPSEFGYRSIHYTLMLSRRRRYGPTALRPNLFGLFAEVQLRTFAEHAWADFGHDLSYKGEFDLPDESKRELATIAAELEDVDRAFARFQEALDLFGSRYGSHLDRSQIDDEIARLEIVLRADPTDAQVAWRLAKFAMKKEDWDKAVSVLTPYTRQAKVGDPTRQPILRDLGVSLCKAHRRERDGPPYRRGQRYLARAIELSPNDVDALSSYAGTWRRDDEEAATFYRRAYEVDPTDYYPLGNFLNLEIRRVRSTSGLVVLHPTMVAALERCRAQVQVGLNLPWAYFGIGKLSLLLGQPLDALHAFAKALSVCTASFMIEGSLASLEELSVVRDELRGYEWARRMLLLGAAVYFPSRRSRGRVARLASRGRQRIRQPVVIVAGGTRPSVAAPMSAYRRMLVEAFRDFRGTIISGGTEQGVSGLVGHVGETYGDAIRTFGYHPPKLPSDATKDARYTGFFRTAGPGFSPLQPLQNWIDLVASGIRPEDVKVLGIGGGEIAAAEYRIALGLGARVGVVQGSGRAADAMLEDPDWASGGSVPMPLISEPPTIRAFVGSGASKLRTDQRETIAKAIHEAHVKETISTYAAEEPSVQDWDKLREDYKDDNRSQADHIAAKLREIGCSIGRPKLGMRAVTEFNYREVEKVAEMEHGRWNATRLAGGWRWGPRKNAVDKISPYLVTWEDLPEDIKKWDRDAVHRIPLLLSKVGLEIHRSSPDKEGGQRGSTDARPRARRSSV